ncbi:MAG: M20 family metallopeptidase [Chloroflexi bacterium]|nr:M20 family metallopeptidase [Chloroflexota bacterium]
MSLFLDTFRQRRDAMLDLLIKLVTLESCTGDKRGVDRLVAFMESQLTESGAMSVRRYAQSEVGDFTLAKWNEGAAGKPILILGHLDTVYPSGSLDTMPIRVADGRLYGPGALDMKAGVLIALEAIRALRERQQLPDRPIHMLLTSDEEIGSPHSEALIRERAAECELVLVMEPATKEGAIKTWRKGGAKYALTIEGRSAHAGSAPQEGINAIIEFAQQALEINRLNDLKYGTSVSITRVDGGSAGNVIPALVRAHIDARALSQGALDKLHADLTNLYPKMPGANVSCVRIAGRPPMERRAELFEKAAAIAERHGLTIDEGGSGGGSDGNFTAAMGVPTLDGLGAHGDGAHAPHEHVIIDSLPRQAALCAALLLEWTQDI